MTSADINLPIIGSGPVVNLRHACVWSPSTSDKRVLKSLDWK